MARYKETYEEDKQRQEDTCVPDRRDDVFALQLCTDLAGPAEVVWSGVVWSGSAWWWCCME